MFTIVVIILLIYNIVPYLALNKPQIHDNVFVNSYKYNKIYGFIFAIYQPFSKHLQRISSWTLAYDKNKNQ